MNKLINETSPYLLQHAHNPVDWHPWGPEALRVAKQLDKPILVSIGYSACHWCHVMEKESFEDTTTAALMNEWFVNIKVDREERPDLDHIYMDAVQNMTGSGGWPLNAFLTPEGKPFYGGTYYPPRRSYNRASWTEVLQAVNEAYVNKKQEVLAHAENLTAHIANANSFGISQPGAGTNAILFSRHSLDEVAANILQQADTEWGGFGRAPKFPQTFAIQFLLQHYYFTKHEAALKQGLLSIDKMIQGGIYDHLAGGFARYSTDTRWLAPHFEKMLYDNALLLNVICTAYQLTSDKRYLAAINQTTEFIEKEMLSPENGFFSALDADSEGVEGKYYVWQKKEVEAILGGDAAFFCAVYNITENGNWEHANILWLRQPLKQTLADVGVGEKEGEDLLATCRKKLLAERAKRVRPGLDDKILTGWNALMITAFCKTYAATANNRHLALAENCMAFLERACGGTWSHTYKNGVAKYPAFLDDYAYLIEAYINLQQVTGNIGYIEKAKELTQKTVADFSDDESLFFWFTPKGQQDVIVRKKEIYDGATPSGNAVMAANLYYLSVMFDMPEWRNRAVNMAAAVGAAVVKYPISFGCWALLLQNIAEGFCEIAVIGPKWAGILAELNSGYLPGKIIQAAPDAHGNYPLLKNKGNALQQTLIYLCKNYACSQPVATAAEFWQMVEKTKAVW